MDQKYLGSSEVWCWRRIEKIDRTDRVKNEEIQRVKEYRNIVHGVKRTKVNWVVHILLANCLLKHIELTGRRGRRSKLLLDGLKERRGYRKSKEEALDRTL